VPTKRIFRLGIITAVGFYFGGQLVKMSARRHLAEDAPGTIGAKYGAVVSA
jgi:hypothetical protein